MKTQPGLDKVTYEFSHNEYKQLVFVVRELAVFLHKHISHFRHYHLGMSLLRRIAGILEVELDGSEEEQTQGEK